MQLEENNHKYPGLAATPFEEIIEFARRIIDRSGAQLPSIYQPIMTHILRTIHEEMAEEQSDKLTM